MLLSIAIGTAQSQTDSLPSSAADWLAAWATAATAVVAFLALGLAVWQVLEARQARKQTKELELEKSQPYVVVTMEELDGNPTILHLVIRNYGQTLARDVRVRINPEPQASASGKGVEKVQYPEVIPALAPGQEWRTVWDFGPEREETDLPDYHSGEVTYSGIDGSPQRTEIILDWSIYKSRHWVQRRGLHDAAEALREISKTHQKWTEGTRGGLQVFTRSGEAKDERLAEQARAWRAKQKETQEQRQAKLDAATETAPQAEVD